MKVSIITPVYKPTRDMWERTKDTVISQSGKNYEWILVIDGCPNHLLDEEIIKVEEFQELEHLAKIVTLWDNYGPSVARNVGFQVSDGDIIAYVDIGDALDYYRVQTLIDVFSNKEVDIVLAPYVIRKGGEPVGVYSPISTIKAYGSLSLALEKANISIPLGVAHKRAPFVEAGGFQPGIVCGEDGLLWRRMVESGSHWKIDIINSIAGDYFINENGQSRTQRRFDMGGFAFDASNRGGSHGQYLDNDWFKDFHSRKLMDK